MVSSSFGQDETSNDSLKVSEESSLIFLNENQLIIDGDTVDYSELDETTMSVITSRKKSQADQEYNFGVKKLSKGKAKEAIEHFTEAIRLVPDFALAYANQGIAFVETKRKNLALINFRKAIELAPDKADIAYFHRGKLSLADKKVDNAFDDFSAAIKINPKFDEALVYQLLLLLLVFDDEMNSNNQD